METNELHRLKALVLATLDYLLLHHTGSIIYDDIDPNKQTYERQKIETEKHFTNNWLDQLEKLLHSSTMSIKFGYNSSFTSYIKEKTGYDFDIWTEHRKSFEAVLAKGRIDTEAELHDVSIMLNDKASLENHKLAFFEPLMQDFFDRQMREIEASPERKKEYDENHELVEEDGELIEKFWSGGRPSHSKNREVKAPDGKRSIRIHESTRGDHSSTEVSIQFENIGCGLHSTEGINPSINAYWKDNQTIVIETKKEFSSSIRHGKIESYGGVITIEYKEI